MAKPQIRCPICSKWKFIEIADDVTKNVAKGLLAINIAAGMICDHSFIAYIDKNLTVRDCLVADFKIELPRSAPTEETEEDASPETDRIKFDLIKLNIPELLMAYVIKAILYGRKTVLILDQEFLFNHIKNFFRYVFDKSFEFDMEIILEEEHKRNEGKYKEFLVFKKLEVIRDKNKIIDPKKLDLEKAIVHKFFAEYDLIAGLNSIRNKLNKIYEFSKDIAELIENHKEKPITSKILINHISEAYGEKIQMPYLNYLIDIVRYYFKVEVPKIDGVSNLLGFL
ncbi:MAG: hypothetical protein HWN81_18790 [Candidatus Lokiarchaeota archaeon]|nr:hypothetical protein [Candidatus Lokiarchaeota archaeon]